MDKLLLNTKFVKNMISKAIAKAALKALGVNISVQLDTLEVEHEEGGKIAVDICASASMNEADLEKLIDKLL